MAQEVSLRQDLLRQVSAPVRETRVGHDLLELAVLEHRELLDDDLTPANGLQVSRREKVLAASHTRW